MRGYDPYGVAQTDADYFKKTPGLRRVVRYARYRTDGRAYSRRRD
jgi:hypothetical protein